MRFWSDAWRGALLDSELLIGSTAVFQSLRAHPAVLCSGCRRIIVAIVLSGMGFAGLKPARFEWLDAEEGKQYSARQRERKAAAGVA